MDKNNETKRLSLIIIIVLLIAVLIIGSEIFIINHSSKKEEESLIKTAHKEEVTTKRTGKYDTSNLVFTSIDIDENEVNLSSFCQNGCNLNLKNTNIKFIIKKNNETGEYHLDLVEGENSLFENKNLGNNIEDTIVLKYGDYKTLNTKIKTVDYYYDYAIFINNNSEYDEIASLNANEMEFLENGIVYYYDVCNSNKAGTGKKVKAVRAPFSKTPAIISSVDASFNWCK